MNVAASDRAARAVLVTGGAGFIGANFVLDWLAAEGTPVVTLDKLTYAGNLKNLAAVSGDPRHEFVRGDIGDTDLVSSLLRRFQPRAVVNFAAETHVDRSIHGPDDFMTTNVVGTFRLLECVRAYWLRLAGSQREEFRFLHVSTDEVYGTLAASAAPFSETSRHAPNSPYAASKAAADHFIRAWHKTYGLPVLTTNCSNNYGPFQFPEKLIPLMICNALRAKPLPVYGDGRQIRDWLHVADHCDAIRVVLGKGRVGETYNIGGWNELANIEVVHAICDVLDAEQPRRGGSYRDLITFVPDRPGHDRRYAIDARKMRDQLDWRPRQDFASGLRTTVRWYLDNPEWIENVTSGAYRDWMHRNYAAR